MRDEKTATALRFATRRVGTYPSSLISHPSKAFTLVELLVVIAVLSLLAALLFPSFARARAGARRTACTSNLKQIGLAFHLYRQDFDGGLPAHLSLVNKSYLRDARALLCPSDGKRGQIAGNDYYEGNTYLPTGVSYEYFPQWQIALDNNWYDPSPDFGTGRWGDLTPLAGCPWHWAASFTATDSGYTTGSGGWELILTYGGSVRKIRIEEPLDQFSPGKYH